MTFMDLKAGHKRNPIPSMDVVKIIDGRGTIPVYVFLDGKTTRSGVPHGKIPVKKIKNVVKSGK